MMDDTISRAAAIAELMQMVKAHEHEIFRGELLHYTGIKAMLEALPAVDAAPVVHGNWIECYERSRHYYCSNCGKVQGIASVVMKYCPECGAKMAEHPWAGRYADQMGAVQDGGENMRLGDYDALNARIDKCVGIDGLGLEPVMAIRDIKALISVMPTIDAIPVEWLRNVLEEAKEFPRAEHETIVAIPYLIKRWQKEQEAHGT